MISVMTISEARKNITSLEGVMNYDDTISITNHGKEVFALMRWDTYECIQETLEILSDPEMSKSLSLGIQQIREDKTIDFDSFMEKLSCTP